MSYGPETSDIFQRSASYVDRILKGADPADLPAHLLRARLLPPRVGALHDAGAHRHPTRCGGERRRGQLDENQPSQRGDMGIGGQHAAALDVLGLLQLLRRVAAAAGRARRLYLR
jgi:hypothetical protein